MVALCCRSSKWRSDPLGDSPTSQCCTTYRATMSHSEALFEKSCLRCQRTPSNLRMGSSGFEQLLNVSINPCAGLIARGDRIPVSICQRVHPIFAIKRLESKGERERHCSDVARRCDGALTAGHPCLGGRFAFRRGPFCTARA